jgi:DnaA family protein
MAEQLPLNFEFRANQTFDDFFPGSNQEVVEHLKKSLAGHAEPQIFIWGDEGSGKSHLLQACCRQAYQQNLTAFYFAFSLAALPDTGLLNNLDKFDVVCFDNIERFAGDPLWERAFFNFFNLHRGDDRKLLLSANRPPQQLAIALPDLKTRLSWGLALKLQPLSEGDSIHALIFKANQMGFEISPQVGHFLLTHYDRNLASLWSLLDTLDRASLAAKHKLTLPFLKKILKQTL